MNELTVLEIAEILEMSFESVKTRIRRKGIEPVRKVGRTNIYAPSVVDLLRDANPVGRPPKAPDKK